MADSDLPESSSDAQRAKAEEEFLLLFRSDVETGAPRPLSDYLDRFPSIEEQVATQWSRYRTNADSGTDGRANPRAPEGEAGRDQFGPFRLIRHLGAGGQGTVHLAEDTRYPRQVALKRLHTHGLGTGNNQVRFAREASLLAQIEHPAVCRLFEAGVLEEQPYLSMEFVGGGSLKDRLPTRPANAAPDEDSVKTSSLGSTPSTRRELESTLEFFEEVARGLHDAHEKGVVHRDVKPGNIMLTSEGRPKVVDFGLAIDPESEDRSLGLTGQPLGTWPYMSPEQARGYRSAVDRRSDVWSLGVTLFQTLTGVLPFQGTSEQALVHAITHRSPPRLKQWIRGVPRDLQTILDRALEKEPRHRLATMREFADELQRVRTRHPIRTRKTSQALRMALWARRNPLASSAFTALLVVVLTSTVVTWSQNRNLSKLNDSLIHSSRRVTEEAQAKQQAFGRERAVLTEYDRLADRERLNRAQRELAELWPSTAAQVEHLRAWMAKHEALFARLEDHRKALQELQARALPYRPEDRQRDHREALRYLAAFERAHADQVQRLGSSESPRQRERIERNIAILDRRLQSLRERVAEQGSHRFEVAGDQFRHDSLASLVRDLDAAIHDAQRGALPMAQRRIRSARRIEALTVSSPDAQERWSACQSRIQSNPKYRRTSTSPQHPLHASLYDPQSGAMLLPVQEGLIPLGPDPRSGLEEFLHLPTQDHDWKRSEFSIPDRRSRRGQPNGYRVEPHTGILFVLIPAGTVLMGAQATDEAGPNYDPAAIRDEGPVHRQSLGAYFLSKYELTQGQWIRACVATGGDEVTPFLYRAGDFDGDHDVLPRAVDLDHPAENLTWLGCAHVLTRMGLEFPTEAQWEYAAKAGVDHARWAGPASAKELPQFANLEGLEKHHGELASYAISRPMFRDRYVIHGPVGSFRPNAFGLHDMTGNVSEWCRDPIQLSYLLPGAPLDGLREYPAKGRCCRGGSFEDSPLSARIALRNRFDPATRNLDLGVRPARRIQLD